MINNKAHVRKINIIISVLLIVVLIGSLMCLSGCYKKHGTTLKIVCRIATWVTNYIATYVGPTVAEYTFPPDVDDVSTSWSYDGKDYGLALEAYSLSKNPTRNEWMHSNKLDYNVYMTTAEDTETLLPEAIIYGRGKYVMTVKLREAEDGTYKERTVRLHIYVV